MNRRIAHATRPVWRCPSLEILCAIVAALSPALRATAQNAAATVTVNANANRHAISPLIYGVAYATQAQLADLNCPLHRSGGNTTSRYNWKLNAYNHAQDWYFESIAETSAVAGESGDTFISTSRLGGAAPMLTIPMVGWVAKLGASRGKLASFSIAKYGAQSDADWQWFPDAGNGILANGQDVTGNNLNDANVPADSAFQQGWMQHIVAKWGTAANGCLRYYILDNEPSIWHATHRDVHPVGASMQEVRDKMIDYATRVRAVDPGALIIGPEEWGWPGYLYSGLDQQAANANGWSSFPDKASHGNWDYLPWLLDQLRQNNVATGRRLLNYFSVHCYPQGGEFSDDTSQAMQLLRNRSTRSLWDPNYVDQSWINDKVHLIRRMRSWVQTYYPGTRTAITEYNWGAEGHINGAIAQADILGIFGREALDMGTRWTTPVATTPTYKAMKMYRNYDGAKSTFGETNVSASGTNPDYVAAYAAQRTADGALTVMVLNKYLTGSTPLTLSLVNFPNAGISHRAQLTSANVITHPADLAFSGNMLKITLPAQSITLFVFPPAVP